MTYRYRVTTLIINFLEWSKKALKGHRDFIMFSIFAIVKYIMPSLNALFLYVTANAFIQQQAHCS